MPETQTNIGITGTRLGATEAQLATLTRQLAWLATRSHVPTLHHGDCVGIDEQAHNLAMDLGWNTTVHPPVNDRYRAYCLGDYEWPPKSYMDRNMDIVRASWALIACPKEDHEVTRSGTWSTVRKARKLGLTIFIIYPNGDKVTEN